MADMQQVRCVIYTRKSAEERADSQLSSIERQRELCEAYVGSQAAEGWQLLPERYDDLGFSGGTLKRPALDRLLADIDRGEIDTIVIYKIDRLTRSLRDFLTLVDRLERRNVALVATTQNFSTTSSMGRLTLNVLLSFAQFERELTGERLRDWFAGARARGLFCHGPAPYGYRAEDLRLIVREDQAAIVRHIYRRYPVLGSCQKLADEVNRMGAVTVRGNPFDYSHVRRILRSRVYLGELPHAGGSIAGTHEPIVSAGAWRRVNREMDESARRLRPRVRTPSEAPLRPLLRDRHGQPMVHLHYERRGKFFRYYVPSRRRYGPGTSPDDRYRAGELEDAVMAMLARIGCSPQPSTRPSWLSSSLRRLVKRIDLREDVMIVTLVTDAEFEAPIAGRVSPTARTRDSSLCAGQ